MKVFVAAAMLLSCLFAGCTSSSDRVTDPEGGNGSPSSTAPSVATPTLYLNITVGNETFRFTSADASATGNASTTSSGNATTTVGSGNTTSPGTSTAPGNGTGNATGGNGTAGNGTASGPGGQAPHNVSVELGATGLPENVSWTLDFGADASASPGSTGNSTGNGGNGTSGNGTAGNGTAGNGTSGSNATEQPSVVNGTTFPATAEYTYQAEGVFTVVFTLVQGNATLASLDMDVTVTAPEATNTTAFGPPPEPIVIEGSITGTFVTEEETDETFELPVPVASMTITLEFDGVTGQDDLDWSIEGPGGEEAAGANGGQEDPETFEDPTPGTWTVTILGWLALEADYTITVTFE